MGITERLIPVKRGTVRYIRSIFGNEEIKPNPLVNRLREASLLDTKYENKFFMGMGNRKIENIVDHNFNFETYRKCYEQIPKVFRAVNTRANFAIQGGYKLRGNKADIDKIKEWERKMHFDTILITMAKEMILYGNVYIDPMGIGSNLELKFLPVKTIRVRRTPTGDAQGHVQLIDNKVVAEWEPKKLIHIKWNTFGTDAYGMTEIRPNLPSLTHKLEAENIIPKIIKFHADSRIVFKLGMPEKPYNDTQIDAWIGKLEERVKGSDIVCAGDVATEVIQPIRGTGEIINLLNHIEHQVNTGLHNAQVLLESSADATGSMIQMDAFEREVRTMQDVIGMYVERDIYSRILGKDDVPQIVWNPMNIETRLRESRTLRQLIGDGKAPPLITIDEGRENLGYEPMPEEDKKRYYDSQQPFQGNGEPNGGNNQPRGAGQGNQNKKMPQVRKKD